MSSRTRSYQPWLWAAALVVLSAGPVSAQPPSPVELVRALRESGQVDLALKALDALEGKPLPPEDPDAKLNIFQGRALSPDDRAAAGLERAKCLLEASEDEPDEGNRVGMVTVAKEALGTFLRTAPNHPRRVEGVLVDAKLTALDAREQLNRARRIDVPPVGETKEEEIARDRAQMKQKDEAKKARPLFLLASKRYAEASELLRAKIDDKGLDANVKRVLEREAFEAELAAGINQFNTAETFMPVSRITTDERKERDKFLEAAKEIFGKLEKGPPTSRTRWVASAWIAEVIYDQDDFNTAAAKVAEIMKSNAYEAEDGKRLAKFFQLRRNFVDALGARVLQKVVASEVECRNWLQQYGNTRKPTAEVFAVRYYRARLLQSLAESTLVKPKDPKAPLPKPGPGALKQFEEAERIYRGLAQTEHDYTARAGRNRMQVVRRLIDDADTSASAYTTFERAQMASLVLLGRLVTAEGAETAAEQALASDDVQADPMKLAEATKKRDAARAEVAKLQIATIAVLERARELATPNDSPADVTDVLLRLIYFYQISGQPYQAAVMGDHVARTIKNTSGKAAVAGLMGLNGYYLAGTRLKPDPSADDYDARLAAKAVDRQRAVALARFLDEKYPNDNSTDAARFRLGALLTEDKRYLDAFEALLKVRPGYVQITSVRLLEGYLAAQLVTQKDLDAAKKVEVFRRAVTDLAKANKPVSVALENEVRGYVSARCRLAQLLLSQGRVDPKSEETNPGYNQALAIAEEMLAIIPTFDNMVDPKTKKLNLDGLEMNMLAQEVRSRALYLRGRALIEAGDLDAASKALEPALEDIAKNGSALTAEMKAWSGGDADADQQAKIVKLAGDVDKMRVEVVLTGFRLRVRQGKAKEGAGLLDLVVKVGGSVEANLPMLEALGREMAAKMINLQKEGRKKEADELGAGLAVLLDKLASVPKLSSQQRLFVGQMQVAVRTYDQAIKTLQQVPEPEHKDWRKEQPDRWPGRIQEITKDTTKIEDEIIKTLPAEDQKRVAEGEREQVVKEKVGPALKGKPQEANYNALQAERAELEKKLAALPMGLLQRHPSQMKDYAVAQLGIAKALRESKKHAEAEKMLVEIVGAPGQPPGWGSGRLYFRKELGTLYEEKALAAPNPKDAGTEWGKARQVWEGLVGIHRAQLTRTLQALPPLPPLAPTATDEEKQTRSDEEKRRKELERQLKNNFADAYFDLQRYQIKAYQHLIKDPAKLQANYETIAKRCVDMEKQIADWDPEIQHRYVDLIKDKEHAPLLVSYKAQGGKIFLEKKPLDP